MQLITVKIDKPEATNFILGQTHFVKTVEDLHETLVTAVPAIKFGLAFCEASGQCLVRWSGTDGTLLGVIDGFRPLGVENQEGIEWRRSLLRKIGYKL